MNLFSTKIVTEGRKGKQLTILSYSDRSLWKGSITQDVAINPRSKLYQQKKMESERRCRVRGIFFFRREKYLLPEVSNRKEIVSLCAPKQTGREILRSFLRNKFQNRTTFFWAKLNQRMQSSPPPPTQIRKQMQKFIKARGACDVTFYIQFYSIHMCVQFYIFTLLQFYNFQASLNHRENACSCSTLDSTHPQLLFISNKW
jgi:hypothetical protein